MKLTFALSCVVMFAAGCATATGSDEGDAAPSPKDGGATSKDAAPAKKDASSQTTNDAGTTQPVDDAGTTIDDSTCNNQSTRNQCEQCCLTVHPSGYKVYQAQLDDCLCNSPAACATECASEVCANKPTTPNDACTTCINAALQSTGACYQGVANACQSDSDCTALFGTCIPPCEQKP